MIKSQKIDITPHPFNMMEAIRRQGYQDPKAIADLCDNSIEAEATFINITVEGEKGSGPRDKVSRILIADDGHGMDETTIDSVIIVGKMRKHTEKGLGKYGQGVKAASLSMGRRLTAFSKSSKRGSSHVVCEYDHDKMKRNNSFAGGATLRQMTDEERVWFDERTEHAGRGTVIEISNLDSLEIKTVDSFVNNLRLDLGRVYRNVKIVIYVNGEPVEHEDYLYESEEMVDISGRLDSLHTVKALDELDISKTLMILNRSKTFSPKRGMKSFKAQFRLCVVPQYPSEGAKPLKKQAGWSLLRCDREIKRAIRWGISEDSHHEQALLRGEIRIMGDADDFFNVNSSKQEIHAPKWLTDEIGKFVRPAVRWAIKYRYYLQSLGEANKSSWWTTHGGTKDRRGKNILAVVKAAGLTNPIKVEKRDTVFNGSKISTVDVTAHKRRKQGGVTAKGKSSVAVASPPTFKIERVDTMSRNKIVEVYEQGGDFIVKAHRGHKSLKLILDRLT